MSDKKQITISEAQVRIPTPVPLPHYVDPKKAAEPKFLPVQNWACARCGCMPEKPDKFSVSAREWLEWRPTECPRCDTEPLPQPPEEEKEYVPDEVEWENSRSWRDLAEKAVAIVRRFFYTTTTTRGKQYLIDAKPWDDNIGVACSMFDDISGDEYDDKIDLELNAENERLRKNQQPFDQGWQAIVQTWKNLYRNDQAKVDEAVGLKAENEQLRQLNRQLVGRKYTQPFSDSGEVTFSTQEDALKARDVVRETVMIARKLRHGLEDEVASLQAENERLRELADGWQDNAKNYKELDRMTKAKLDEAVGLLREVSPTSSSYHRGKIQTFLASLDGEKARDINKTFAEAAP